MPGDGNVYIYTFPSSSMLRHCQYEPARRPSRGIYPWFRGTRIPVRCNYGTEMCCHSRRTETSGNLQNDIYPHLEISTNRRRIHNNINKIPCS